MNGGKELKAPKGRKFPVKWNPEDLHQIVPKCNTYADVLRKLGLKTNYQGNYYIVQDWIKFLNIDISHILSHGNVEVDINELLVKNSKWRIRGQALKKRIIKHGLMKDICVKCGVGPVWNNKKLVLVLDHINGNNRDNRIKNLRILCPNCHSQTKTFAGRNRGKINS